MNEFEVKLRGFEGVARRMREMPTKLQRKGLRKAARAAMAPVRDAARASARQFDDPSSPRQIWKNIVVQEATRMGRKEGGVVMRVGVRGGARKSENTGTPGGDTWYWRLLEFGTQKMRARPFLRPALENNAQKVADDLAAVLKDEIDDLARGSK